MPVLTLSAGASTPMAQSPKGAAALWGGRHIEVGLVNNMPDAAVESTERQFLKLLSAAAGDIPVHLRLFALPDVPRADTARQKMTLAYNPIEALFNSRLDGLIVTGTEPRASHLHEEPYWGTLARVLEWAQENTFSTIWSCLAAHAAVLYMDDIPRHLLPEKLTGMYACATYPPHPLLAGLPAQIRVAHSRWNELRADALLDCNYRILTQSSEGGIDTLVKERGSSLFVLFQGHPEYDQAALLREYRRDVGRFLRHERDAYPAIPRGYLDPVGADALVRFQERAVARPRESMLDSFPFAFVESRLAPVDARSAPRIYRNWLSYLHAKGEQRRRASPDRRALRSRTAGFREPAQGIG